MCDGGKGGAALWSVFEHCFCCKCVRVCVFWCGLFLFWDGGRGEKGRFNSVGDGEIRDGVASQSKKLFTNDESVWKAMEAVLYLIFLTHVSLSLAKVVHRGIPIPMLDEGFIKVL